MHQALIVSLVTPEQKCLVMCCFSGTCSSGRPGTSPIPCSLFIRIPVIPGYGCIKKMSGALFRNRIAAADLRPVVHIHRDYGNADDLVVLVEAHDLHTFGTTPDDPDLADRCPDDNAGRGHDKDLVGPGDGPRLDDNGIAFEHHGADSLRCPAVPRKSSNSVRFPKPTSEIVRSVCSLSTRVIAQTVSSLTRNRIPMTPDAFRPTTLTVSSWNRRPYPKRVD